MRIEHVVYLTLEEWYDLIKESGAQSKPELKTYIGNKYNMTTEFSVHLSDNEAYNFEVIRQDERGEEGAKKIDRLIDLDKTFTVSVYQWDEGDDAVRYEQWSVLKCLNEWTKEGVHAEDIMYLPRKGDGGSK